MLTWEDRIEIIKDACDVKNNRQLEEALGLSNGYINDLIRGKNKNPAKLTAALVTVLKVNPVWFYDETVGIFGEKANKKQQIDIAVHENIRFLDVFDEHIINVIRRNGQIDRIEERLARLEASLGGKGGREAVENGDSGGFTGEAEPEYEAEELVGVPYMENIAAGPPITQSEDQSGRVLVPARLVKKNHRYYAATVRGTSMAEAGIRDGDTVLIRHTDAPADGAIQVVRYRGKSTLKRLKEVEGGGWELHYNDGTGKVIPASSGDYEVQGEFVTALRGIEAPGKGKKGPRTHEKPLENR